MASDNVRLGTKPFGHEGRDAIHIAVMPVIAACELSPGEHVGVLQKVPLVVGPRAEPHVGIIDPFLREHVKSGETAWLLLYPQTITGLRHHWSHPVIPDGQNTMPAMVTNDEWELVMHIAQTCGKTPEALIQDAEAAVRSDEWLLDNSERYKNVSPDKWNRFWAIFVKITGERPSDDIAHYGGPYTCSC